MQSLRSPRHGYSERIRTDNPVFFTTPQYPTSHAIGLPESQSDIGARILLSVHSGEIKQAKLDTRALQE